MHIEQTEKPGKTVKKGQQTIQNSAPLAPPPPPLTLTHRKRKRRGEETSEGKTRGERDLFSVMD
jgi:hypothetical protein